MNLASYYDAFFTYCLEIQGLQLRHEGLYASSSFKDLPKMMSSFSLDHRSPNCSSLSQLEEAETTLSTENSRQFFQTKISSDAAKNGMENKVGNNHTSKLAVLFFS